MFIAGIVILLIIIGGVLIFLNGASFGSLPSEETFKRIRKSAHFRDGQIQNLSPTPSLTEGAGFFSLLKKFCLNKSPENRPRSPLPAKKTALLHLDPGKNILL